MKRLTLLFTFSIGCIQLFAQQWSGSSTTSGSISRDGNVGIGTSYSGARLNISQSPSSYESLVNISVDDAPSDYFRITNSTGSSNQFIPHLSAYHNTDNRQTLTITGSTSSFQDNGDRPLVSFDARLSGNLAVSVRPLFEWKNYDQVKMILGANGNLGIGTTSPSYKLDLNAGADNTHARFIGSYSGPQGIQVERSGGDNIRLVANYSGYGGGLESSSALRFSVNGNSISNPSMYINGSGQIGIGTTSTGSHKLVVEGSIGAREVKVEVGTWSDHVFHHDYPLMNLEEVSTYIIKNHHLPNIPTKSEVQENGINLGEMNAKLLEKIEELTLYLIEQNKEIAVLKAKVNTLERK